MFGAKFEAEVMLLVVVSGSAFRHHALKCQTAAESDPFNAQKAVQKRFSAVSFLGGMPPPKPLLACGRHLNGMDADTKYCCLYQGA